MHPQPEPQRVVHDGFQAFVSASDFVLQEPLDIRINCQRGSHEAHHDAYHG